MASETSGERMKFAESDPRHHTIKLKDMLQNAAEHAREDVQKVSDPQARALFEVTAEVLIGLTKAFRDYEEKKEPAWR
jgi:hypothetical protein